MNRSHLVITCVGDGSCSQDAPPGQRHCGCAFKLFDSLYLFNPGKHVGLQDVPKQTIGYYVGVGTNNWAEFSAYRSCINYALNTAKYQQYVSGKKRSLKIIFYTDSQCLINWSKIAYQIYIRKRGDRVIQKPEGLCRDQIQVVETVFRQHYIFQNLIPPLGKSEEEVETLKSKIRESLNECSLTIRIETLTQQYKDAHQDCHRISNRCRVEQQNIRE